MGLWLVKIDSFTSIIISNSNTYLFFMFSFASARVTHAYIGAPLPVPASPPCFVGLVESEGLRVVLDASKAGLEILNILFKT